MSMSARKQTKTIIVSVPTIKMIAISDVFNRELFSLIKENGSAYSNTD
jgi:hypothetical protein